MPEAALGRGVSAGQGRGPAVPQDPPQLPRQPGPQRPRRDALPASAAWLPARCLCSEDSTPSHIRTQQPFRNHATANSRLRTPARGRLPRALQGTSSARKQPRLPRLQGTMCPVPQDSQAAAAPGFPHLPLGSGAAPRGQATAPASPAAPAESRSNLCYALRERATFLSPPLLQLTLRTFKSF